MRPIFHTSIPVELSQVQPFGDLVLVRAERDHDSSMVVIAPAWRNKRDPGCRRGTVLAVGPGDRMIHWSCGHDACTSVGRHPVFSSYGLYTAAHPPLCPCGRRMNIAGLGPDKRAPMHVKVGDEILYHRAPANHFNISGVEYLMLHEEQHVLAVLERDDVA